MGRTWLCPNSRKASTKLHETLAKTLALYLSVICGYHGPRVSIGLRSPRGECEKGAIGCVL